MQSRIDLCSNEKHVPPKKGSVDPKQPETKSKQRKVFEIRFPKRHRNEHNEYCFHTQRTALVVAC